MILAGVWFVPICALGDEPQDSASVLIENVGKLRSEAKYNEALEAAKELLALRQSVDTTPPYKLGDAKRLVQSLEFITGLPEDEQKSLAVADSLTAEIKTLYSSRKYSESMALVKNQLQIRRSILGEEHPDVAQSLRRLGNHYYAVRDYANAAAAYEEALAISKRILGETHPNIKPILDYLAHSYYAMGQYAAAEPFYRESVAISRTLDEQHLADIKTLRNLGNCLRALWEIEAADSLYREALAERRTVLGDDHDDIARIISSLAELHYREQNYAVAEPLYREALAMRQRLHGPEHRDVAASMHNLAILFDDQDDYTSAETLYRESLAMTRRLEGPEHPDVAWSLSSLAGLLDREGDYAAAEELYEEAIAILRNTKGDENWDVARMLHNQSLHFNRKGDYDTAEQLAIEAIAMYRKLGGENNPMVGHTLNIQATALLKAKDYAAAEQVLNESLAILRKSLGEEHRSVARGITNLAAVNYFTGDYAAAESLYTEALGIYSRTIGEQNSAFAATLQNIAILFTIKHEYAPAESLLSRSAEIYEQLRLRAGRGIARVTFQESPYPRLASVRLAMNKPGLAWEAVERGLGRGLADLLIESDTRRLDPHYVAREDSLRYVLATCEREFAVYQKMVQRDSSGTSQSGLNSARDDLLAAEAAWSAFQNEIAERYPVAKGITYPLQRVQSAIDRNTAIIGWLDVEQENEKYASWTYVIRDKGEVVWARIEDSSEETTLTCFERARLFRDALSAPGMTSLAVTGTAETLWSDRIDPVSESLENVNHLIVIPSGAMLGVPVEPLLNSNGLLLGQQFEVSYIPSATICAWLEEQSENKRKTIVERTLLVGDPPFNDTHLIEMAKEEDQNQMQVAYGAPVSDRAVFRNALAGNETALASLPRLPGSRREVQDISIILPGATLLVGAQATEQELARMAASGELRNYASIHLATHAFVNDDQPEQSALVLSQVDLPDPLETVITGARFYDGLLTAKEVLHEWRLDADLVTLSGCETALGQIIGGEGYVGFSHVFFQVGAKSVLVSLWKVDDRSTSLLMQRFYENWSGRYRDNRGHLIGRPMPKEKALQEAKQYLRTYRDEAGEQPFEHPFHWSAFVLIGNRN